MLQVQIKDKVVDINDCERTVCEIWNRVMGYYRPVSEYNIGKKSEFAERKYYTEYNAMRSIVGVI